jgi:hypothetical protein
MSNYKLTREEQETVIRASYGILRSLIPDPTIWNSSSLILLT